MNRPWSDSACTSPVGTCRAVNRVTMSARYRHPAHQYNRSIQIDALKELQRQTDSELAALLPAILDRAFKGEL